MDIFLLVSLPIIVITLIGAAVSTCRYCISALATEKLLAGLSNIVVSGFYHLFYFFQYRAVKVS